MTYEIFLERLEEALYRKLGTRESIRLVRVLKNNGICLDGFAYQPGGRRERPTVYVNHYYEADLKEENIEEIAGELLDILKKSARLSKEQLRRLSDPKEIRDKIFFRLISKERNRELLDQVPWMPWLDLAIVFYIRIPEEIIPNATALIHDHHLSSWNLDRKQLYRLAMENMERQSYELHPVEDILRKTGQWALSTGMYVVETGEKYFGAASIVLPRVQKMCQEKLQGSFYMLPSSIHEVLVLPAGLSDGPKELNRLVRSVNDSAVEAEDYLSDHAYFYDAEKGCFQG